MGRLPHDEDGGCCCCYYCAEMAGIAFGKVLLHRISKDFGIDLKKYSCRTGIINNDY